MLDISYYFCSTVCLSVVFAAELRAYIWCLHKMHMNCLFKEEIHVLIHLLFQIVFYVEGITRV